MSSKTVKIPKYRLHKGSGQAFVQVKGRRHYHSSGHVWQGRFKALPIEGDEHLLTVMRYVDRQSAQGHGASDARPRPGSVWR